MARKETPDVLGEILSGTVPEPTQPARETKPGPQAQQPAQRKTAARAPKSAKPPVQPSAPRWDYLVVSFANRRGWRPRYINGGEIQGWMDAPLIHDYVAQLGEDGWELVGASSGKNLYGSTDSYQLFFKRPKH